MNLPVGWTSIMPVRCGWCNTLQGHKDGGGETGITSTICEYCREWYTGELAKRHKGLSNAA